MTREQQLQLELNKLAFPEIKDRLNFGSEIISKIRDGRSLNIGELKIIGSDAYFDGTRIQINGYNYETSDFEVLGYPIALELILKAGEDKFKIDGYGKGNVRICLYRGLRHFYWILCKPFHLQPKETQEAIYSLFNIE
jgi:hypothetical protein